LKKIGPQMASTADPVLTGAVEVGAVLQIIATIIIGKIKSSFGHKFFFSPVEGWQ
jgi:hypothetical protein